MNGHVAQWSVSKAMGSFSKVNGASVNGGVSNVQNNMISCENMTFKEIVNMNRTKTSMTSESHNMMVNGDAVFSEQIKEEKVTEEEYLNDVDHDSVSRSSRNSRTSDSSLDGLNICYYKLK